MSLELSLLLIPFSSWLLFAAFWLLLLLPQQEDVSPPVAFLIAVVRCCCIVGCCCMVLLCCCMTLHDIRFLLDYFPPELPLGGGAGHRKAPSCPLSV